MKSDPTATLRRELAQEINAMPITRELLENAHGQVWDNDQLREEFEVTGFATPLIVVKRRSDEQRGSLFFTHHPRFYYGFEAA